MITKKFIEENQEYPLVLMGDAVTDFYKSYEGPVVQVNDDRELKDTLAYYSGIPNLGRPLVISDISFIPGSNLILLKFLEETPLQVILLSRYDKLDPIITSRIRKIVKYYKDKTDSKFMNPAAGYKLVEEKLSNDSSYFDKVRYWGKFSPSILKLEKTIKSSRVKERLKSML